jgi:hypothetical protein
LFARLREKKAFRERETSGKISEKMSGRLPEAFCAFRGILKREMERNVEECGRKNTRENAGEPAGAWAGM